MCFSKECTCPDDNLKSTLLIHMKFGESVCYIDVWKSLTFVSDPIQNGRLINDLLNVTIFLNAENAKTHLSQKRSEIERLFMIQGLILSIDPYNPVCWRKN